MSTNRFANAADGAGGGGVLPDGLANPPSGVDESDIIVLFQCGRLGRLGKVDPGEVVQRDEPIRYYEKWRDVPDPILAGRPVRKMWPSEAKGRQD